MKKNVENICPHGWINVDRKGLRAFGPLFSYLSPPAMEGQGNGALPDAAP